MKPTQITKMEHSCFIIEHKDRKILIDPGSFTKPSDKLHGMDILLLTHVHGDHFNLDNIQYVISHAGGIVILCNKEVKKILKKNGIESILLQGNNSLEIDSILFEAHDHRHEEIYEEFGQVRNTGYYVDEVFFHPGDAFAQPRKNVEAIATVISAPFMQIKSAVDYVKSNPNMIHIGVHDGIIIPPIADWLTNIIHSNIERTEDYKFLKPYESISL